MDLLILLSSIIAAIPTGFLAYVAYRQHKLQELMFLREQASFLVYYLILIRDYISKMILLPKSLDELISIFLNPSCPEARGTYGLYLTYLKNTLGYEYAKKLEHVFNVIHEYLRKEKEEGKVLPSNVVQNLIKELNDLINEIIRRYPIKPDNLYPEQCLKEYELKS